MFQPYHVEETPRFRDRGHAGDALARRLEHLRGEDVLVLALPRGGVPVAYPVSVALDAPLDLFIVRKLGVPGHEELAFGAIATGGIRVLNDDVVQGFQIHKDTIEEVTQREHQELVRRERLYRGNEPPPQIQGRVVVLVDDGLATGATMRVAVRAVRQQRPRAVIVAVPVAAANVCEAFHDEADDVICAMTPEPFYAVGMWYDDFSQTTDEEVAELLSRRRVYEN